MTRLQSCALVVGAVALAGAISDEASAQRRDRDNWEQLGCEDVGRRPDRDIIKVGRREGRFKAIRLSASGNVPVFVTDSPSGTSRRCNGASFLREEANLHADVSRPFWTIAFHDDRLLRRQSSARWYVPQSV